MRHHTGDDGFILCFDTLLGTRDGECMAMLAHMHPGVPGCFTAELCAQQAGE